MPEDFRAKGRTSGKAAEGIKVLPARHSLRRTSGGAAAENQLIMQGRPTRI